MSPRLDTLRSQLGGLTVEGFLVTHIVNVRYLSGFTGSAGNLLVTEDKAIFFSDGRYEEQSRAQVHDCEIDIGPGGTLLERIAAAVQRLGIERLGIEAEHVSLALHARLGEQVGNCTLIPTCEIVELLRRVKDDDEISRLRRAAAINDRTVEIALQSLREGITERQVARIIRDAVEALGAEAIAFDTIVLFGARSSLPHGVPGEVPLRYRDIVLLDFGARVDGYHGDITRTVVFGEPPPLFAERYEAVRTAQEAVTKGWKPGMSCHEVDALARDRLARAGLAEAFKHGTGHGLGLEIHEAPRFAPAVDVRLVPGCVMTNEPGIYFAGWGGIRIEDMLVLREEGAECLTHAPRELRVL